jgi:hypothetical protein
VPWELAESQRISGKCWPKVGGGFANQASSLYILRVPTGGLPLKAVHDYRLPFRLTIDCFFLYIE